MRTFSLIPASAMSVLLLFIIGIFLLSLMGFFAFIGYSVRNTKFEVNELGLRLKGSLYGRFIPREEIVKEGVKVINLNMEPEYKPKLRTNGINLPGYNAGWFRLKTNEKALLYVTDVSKVVYVPTNQSYSLLLSVSNPEEFRQSLELWK